MQELPGGGAVDAALEDRLHEHQDGAGPCHLLRVDQLLAGADLSGGDEVLHARHHHRDHGPRLRGAGHHGGHADLHHLCST